MGIMEKCYMLTTIIKLDLMTNMKLIKAIKINSSIEFVVEKNGQDFEILFLLKIYLMELVFLLNVCLQLPYCDEKF